VHWLRSYWRSRVRTAVICRKPCFLGQTCVYATVCALGPCLHAGCASAAWVRAWSRGNDMGAGRRCLTLQGGGFRWSGPPHNGSCMSRRCAWATFISLNCFMGPVDDSVTTNTKSQSHKYEWKRGGLGNTVSSHGAGSGMRGRLGWCCVR
jgi:hypothetical protein